MTRPLPDIISHIRAVAGDPSISTTLIQTEDLLALCDAAESAGPSPSADQKALIVAARNTGLVHWDAVKAVDAILALSRARSVPKAEGVTHASTLTPAERAEAVKKWSPGPSDNQPTQEMIPLAEWLKQNPPSDTPFVAGTEREALEDDLAFTDKGEGWTPNNPHIAAMFMPKAERDPFIRLLASLAAAISLLERGGKEAAPSDKMFDQMLTDYRAALEAGRAALRRTVAERATEPVAWPTNEQVAAYFHKNMGGVQTSYVGFVEGVRYAKRFAASPAAPSPAEALVEQCAKIADPWPGFAAGEPSTEKTDLAVIEVRTKIAAAIRALTAQPATAGECQHCHDYVGKCPYCGRKRPAVGGEREKPAQLAKVQGGKP